MKIKVFSAPSGDIIYWADYTAPGDMTLIFLPGLTADHRLFQRQLETLRRGNAAFEASAEFHTLDTGDNAVLGLSRTGGGQTLVGLFNFGGEAKKVTLPAGSFTDMTTASGKKKKALNGPVTLPPYSFFWLQKKA